MRHLAVRVTENADLMVRKCALAVDQVLATETPVRTGRARSNWLVTFNAPASGQVPSLGPGAGALQLAQARATISTYRGDVHRSIHITNNLPYINRLNQGWSRQAPAGYVEMAVMKGVEAIGKVDILS